LTDISQRDKITIKAISENINLKDREICFILKEKYPKIFLSLRLDSLRRRIGMLREENNLNRDDSHRGLLESDISLYLKKFKEDTTISIAKKLHLKHPHYKLRSILTYVHYRQHWEV